MTGRWSWVAIPVVVAVVAFFGVVVAAGPRHVAERSFRYKVELFNPIDAPKPWLVSYASDVAVIRHVAKPDSFELGGYEIIAKFVADVRGNALSLGDAEYSWIDLWDEEYEKALTWCRFSAEDKPITECLKEIRAFKSVSWNSPVFRNGARITDLRTGNVVFSITAYRHPGNWQPGPPIEYTVVVDPSLTDSEHIRYVERH